jgi:hypothetical protein
MLQLSNFAETSYRQKKLRLEYKMRYRETERKKINNHNREQYSNSEVIDA